MSWTLPWVTGHKYKIHWAVTGIDFEKIKVEISDKYLETDKNVYIVHNFTDVRGAMNVTRGMEYFN